jgi:uncharacterized NAD(P)/FAD-binding protein YdhS
MGKGLASGLNSKMLDSPVTERSNAPQRIAIVGGGASGALVAIGLLREARAPLHLVVIEPSERLGRGIAYGTSCSSHLLNVRAGAMSAYPEAPAHFVEWLRKNVDPGLTAQSFAQRTIYGRYIEDQLCQAQIGAASCITFEHIRSRVVGVDPDPDGAVLALDDGTCVKAEKVVLALGNPAPSNPLSNLGSPVPLSPWTPFVAYGIQALSAVLLIGSGLTAVDVVLALDDNGHRGPIHVISRHGHWPLIHGPAAALRSFMGADDLPDSVRDLTAVLRREAYSITDDGGSWRSALDGLRPFTNALWSRLASGEKRRFFRHLRPYWDIHRHRMAPEVAERLARMSCEGRVFLHGGRVVSTLEGSDGSIAVSIRLRKSGEAQSLVVQRIINCTGPGADYREIDQPLVGRLLDLGVAQQDEMGLGLLTSDDGSLIGLNGSASNVFYTLGPPRKGALWETTAIPEIRVQAAALASLLLKS